MKICMLPIDSRPCTYNFPVQLSKILGYDLIVPPIEMMDFFKQSSSYEDISKWLEDTASKHDIIVLSVDQLLYGGLISSRQNYISLDEAKKRLGIVKKLKQNNPNLKIYAYNILMRTTVSTINAESKIWWEKVSEYSRAYYLNEVDDSNKHKKAVEELENEIPKDILQEFWDVRNRNHIINKLCLQLVWDNIVERLLILQEDCSIDGIQKFEQNVLQDIICDNNIQNKTFIHNGTDEAGMEICMLALNTIRNKKPIKIKWLGENKDFTARYEDREFSENLYSHMKMLNLCENDNADDVLFIYPPKKQQGDYCPKIECSDKYSNNEMNCFAEEIISEYNNNKHCFLLDLCYSNGGDADFMKILSAKLDLENLCGYAAWNTASNSLGTILSQIIACNSDNTKLNKIFTKERILDDLVYQAVVRDDLEKKLIKQNQDIWCINNTEIANKMLNKSFDDNKGFLNKVFNQSIPAFNSRIWWPRTFEIYTEID